MLFGENPSVGSAGHLDVRRRRSRTPRAAAGLSRLRWALCSLRGNTELRSVKGSFSRKKTRLGRNISLSKRIFRLFRLLAVPHFIAGTGANPQLPVSDMCSCIDLAVETTTVTFTIPLHLLISLLKACCYDENARLR